MGEINAFNAHIAKGNLFVFLVCVSRIHPLNIEQYMSHIEH